MTSNQTSRRSPRTNWRSSRVRYECKRHYLRRETKKKYNSTHDGARFSDDFTRVVFVYRIITIRPSKSVTCRFVVMRRVLCPRSGWMLLSLCNTLSGKSIAIYDENTNIFTNCTVVVPLCSTVVYRCENTHKHNDIVLCLSCCSATGIWNL